MPLREKLKQKAHQLKAETFALYLAARHPDTPWYAKLLVAAIVAYAFSPIDLIPDFIPIIGYLDDLVLIPIGIALAIKLVPPPVLAECRARAQQVMANGKPVSRVAGAVIVMIWLALAAWCVVWAYEVFIPTLPAMPNPAGNISDINPGPRHPRLTT
ncbi:YkvA family protein [Azonexus sp. IMCC34842]|uniref:YkvA family protein n=1 Tax=Azonexus sp. IMCC34842 TaxID=3420950 RepID=UPI003D0C9803